LATLKKHSSNNEVSEPRIYFNTGAELSMSGRKFLIEELGLSATEIDYLKKIRTPTSSDRKKFSLAEEKKQPLPLTWCNGLITNDDVEEVRNATNCHYFFPTLCIEAQIAENHDDEALVDTFKRVQPKFDDDHLKNIADAGLSYCVNGTNYAITHELRIASSLARILLISLPSDRIQAPLYIPVLYRTHGIHTNGDAKSVKSFRKPLDIDWQAELLHAQDLMNKKPP
jgi:hypothetical protein